MRCCVMQINMQLPWNEEDKNSIPSVISATDKNERHPLSKESGCFSELYGKAHRKEYLRRIWLTAKEKKVWRLEPLKNLNCQQK